jgi:hypothetical protein
MLESADFGYIAYTELVPVPVAIMDRKAQGASDDRKD